MDRREVAASYGLRFYQQDAFLAVESRLGQMNTLPLDGPDRSTLVEMPTGMGKTRLFSALAAECAGRVLVLAHRRELIHQARSALEQATGRFCDVEMGNRTAYSSQIVVGSIQSVRQSGRLNRLGRDGFKLVIIDEAHRSESNSYRKVMSWFRGAKVLGVTATPDRGDKKSLSNTFDSVAYRISIEDGVRWGYLCPPRAVTHVLDDLDLSHVRKSAGDLNQGQLDEAVVATVGSIVRKTLELYPTEQGIAFFPGVNSAMLACETFNRLEPDSAVFVCGKTPEAEREESLRLFKQGHARWLCNVDVASEGFDHPPAEVAVIASPTTSRALYAQRAGRVTRPTCTDELAKIDGEDEAACALRRAAITLSSKPRFHILDFVGAACKHSLIAPEDIFAKDGDELVLKHLKENPGLSEKSDKDPMQALARAREDMRRLAEFAAQAKASIRSAEVDAFRPDPDAPLRRYHGSDAIKASDAQLRMLADLGVEVRGRPTKKKASKLINEAMEARYNAGEEHRLVLEYLPVPKGIDPRKLKSAANYIRKKRAQGSFVDKRLLKMTLQLGR